jgi:N-[(2S)-2-amino-2-carboxyethyl]-L-glutamate dehydrogenase
MHDDDILILGGSDINSLLAGRELELINAVRMAYETHARGESSLPHSTFLRFPDNQRDRIIALPAYLGGKWEVAGIKWVASFPGNLERGMDRASALVVLNSSRTGRPEAILEGSIISAQRTAASAALATQYLHRDNVYDVDRANQVGMIGCGLINFEIARFLLAAQPAIEQLVVYDLDSARAAQFKRKCQKVLGELEVEIVENLEAVLERSALISIATTAVKPYIDDLSKISRGSTILHISLRDLSPEVILSGDNVVDDIEHICRTQTSVHLTEQLTGNRDFIRCTLADILSGRTSARKDPNNLVVFSPFGLGGLDLAVSKLVRDLGLKQNRGRVIRSFLPEPWADQ